MELFLDTLTKSSRKGTQIIFPSDTDDETFDNFDLRKHCKNVQCSPTPKQLKGKEKRSEQKFHVILKSIIRDIIRKEKFRPFVSDKSKTNPWELDESDVKATKCLGLWSGFSTVMPIKDIYNAKKGSKEEPVTLLRHTEFSKIKKNKLSQFAKDDNLRPRSKAYSKQGFFSEKR